MLTHCWHGSTQSYWVFTWEERSLEMCFKWHSIFSSACLLKTLPVFYSWCNNKLFQEDRQTSTGFDSQPALFWHSCTSAIFMKLMPLFWPYYIQDSMLPFHIAIQLQSHQQAGAFIRPTEEMSTWLWNVSMSFLTMMIPRIMQLEIHM